MAWSARVGSWFRSPPALPAGTTRLARVVDNVDPSGLGRVKIELTGDSAPGTAQWARVATLMAGPDLGSWFLPDVDAEVVVAFDHGDPDHPIVLGSLWNDRARPPHTASVDSSRCTIVTRSGAQIVIDDSSGNSVVELLTGGGRHVTLDDRNASINVSDGAGNSVVVGPSGISVSSVSEVSILASKVSVSASTVDVAAAMVTVSSVLKCDTLIANSVVASSYTPGAGNIW